MVHDAEAPKLSTEVRPARRFSAFFLANGTLDVELLGELDYRPALVEWIRQHHDSTYEVKPPVQ